MDAEILEALSLANDILGVRSRWLVTACLNSINSFHERTGGVHAQIVYEIIARSARFEANSFAHERRGSNKQAHRLARSGEIGRRLWSLNSPHGVNISVKIVP